MLSYKFPKSHEYHLHECWPKFTKVTLCISNIHVLTVAQEVYTGHQLMLSHKFPISHEHHHCCLINSQIPMNAFFMNVVHEFPGRPSSGVLAFSVMKQEVLFNKRYSWLLTVSLHSRRFLFDESRDKTRHGFSPKYLLSKALLTPNESSIFYFTLAQLRLETLLYSNQAPMFSPIFTDCISSAIRVVSVLFHSDFSLFICIFCCRDLAGFVKLGQFYAPCCSMEDHEIPVFFPLLLL